MCGFAETGSENEVNARDSRVAGCGAPEGLPSAGQTTAKMGGASGRQRAEPRAFAWRRHHVARPEREAAYSRALPDCRSRLKPTTTARRRRATRLPRGPADALPAGHGKGPESLGESP